MTTRKNSSKPAARLYRETPSGRIVPVRSRSKAEPLAAEHRSFWIRHRHALRELGRETYGADWRNAFKHSGCIATIIAAIEAGNHRRAEILVEVKCSHSSTYEHVGYLLGQMCGPDPKQHLWFKDEEGLYHLHDSQAAVEMKLAA